MLSNIAIVNAYADVTVRYTLTASAAGRLEIDNTLTETELLGRIANDAIGLLGGRDLIRVKECAHDRCGVLFEDRSNGLKRQWCSMRKCGNVSKAERFSKR
ncbi:CGNR zinc finger [Corynebacterium bovis DSM 20582 = CIP 54.80]|nr:CGNR zinc finger [Corynebacterium bovis DSM 20582 = CIP 54.80]